MFFRCKNDEHWTMLYVSQGVENLLGFTPEEIINIPENAPVNLIHPDDLDRVNRISDSCNPNNGKVTLEYRVRTKRGKIKWIRETNIPIVENGEVKYFEGYLRDISNEYNISGNNSAYTATLEMLAEGKPLSLILNFITGVLEKEFPGSIPSVLKIRENRVYLAAKNRLPHAINDIVNGLEIGENVGSCGAAAFLKKRVIHTDLENHPNWTVIKALVAKEGLRSCWSEPIKSSAGEVLGTFGIYWKDLREPTEIELQKLSGVVHLASIAMEKKSREDERQTFLTILDNQPLNEVYLLNPEDGKIEYANTGALYNLDYTLDELKQKSVIDLNGSCDMNRYKKLVKSLLETGEQQIFFYSEHQTKSGKVYPVEVNLQKIFWGGKSVLLANAVDISEKREARRRLAESEETLAKAEKIADLGSWRYYPNRDEIKGSENFFELLNIPRTKTSRIPRAEVISVLTKKYTDRFNDALNQVIEIGHDIRLQIKASINGKSRYFDLVIRRDGENPKTDNGYIIGIIRDVTYTVKSKKEQSRLSGILNAVFENTDYGIFIKDIFGKYTYVNKAYSDLHSTLPAGLIGKTDFDLHSADEAKEYERYDNDVMTKCSAQTFESTRVATSGVTYHYLITKGPLIINGKVKGVYAIMKNVTAEKEAADLLEMQNERLQKINEELGQLVSHTSHDLRSPLASIKGLVSLSEIRYPEDEELQELFDLMKQSLEKSENLINSILELSKGDILGLQTSVCNPAEIAEKHIDAIKYMPEAKDIHFEVKQLGSTDVETDEVRLTAILSNLITNAAKYSCPDEKNKRVEVVVNCREDSLHIHVNDNGVGIPADKREDIFKIFKRNSSQSGGVGLGLYIVSRMIQALNGEIKVEDYPPRGTSMQVEIPLTVNQAEPRDID